MNKLKLYKYAIVGLVLLNIGILAFMYLKKSSHPHKGFGPERAFEILHLNPDQQPGFIQLAEEHRARMDSLNTLHRSQISEYFATLHDNTTNVNALNNLSKIEKEKAEITYKHFEEIRSFLDDDQIQYFEKFVDKITKTVLGGGNRKRPGKHPKKH